MKAALSLVASFVLLGSGLAWGQTASTGALHGLVMDEGHFVIPNAEISLTSLATGEVRHLVSGKDGSYSAPLLPPGTYKLEVTAAGFKSSVDSHVTIVVTEITNLDVPLPVGDVSQQIEVLSEGSILQTDSSSLGGVIDSKTLTGLPLVKRNYTEVMDLSPGIAQDVNNALELGRGTGSVVSGGVSALGSSPGDNNFQINGADANDLDESNNGFSAGTPVPNPDSIQEFKVQVAGADASYGRSAGANINVITKTGTNQLHGNAFEFFRNEIFNANDYFFKLHGQQRPEVRQNQFGGTIGGPIKRDKLFFFFSYQGTRQIQTFSAGGSRGACSSSLNGQPAVTSTNRTAAGLGATFAGAKSTAGATVDADGSNISPVAVAFFNRKLANGSFLYPNPQNINSSAPAISAGSSVLPQKCTFNEDQYPASVDYVLSPKADLAVKFFTASSNSISPYPLSSVPGFPAVVKEKFYSSSIAHTYTISPRLINQAILGYTRIVYGGTTQTSFQFNDLGINAPQDGNIPILAVNGSYFGQSEPDTLSEDTYTLSDAVSYDLGHHKLRMGGSLVDQRVVIGQYQIFDEVSYNNWADFLIGQPGSYVDPNNAANHNGPSGNVYLSYEEYANTSRASRLFDKSLYLQDDWNITPQLTLNLGMRYDYFAPVNEQKGKVAWLNFADVDPNPATTGTLQGWIVPSNFTSTIPGGVTKFNNSSATYEVGKNVPAPRIGFAYQPYPNSDRVVVRGSAGLFYVHETFQTLANSVTNQPYGQFRVLSGAGNAAATAQNPFVSPYLSSQSLPQFHPYYPGSTLGVGSQDPASRPGRTEQFTFDVQTALTSSLRLEVEYLGKRATNLLQVIRPNQASLASPFNPIRGQTINTQANEGLRTYTTGFTTQGFTYTNTEGSAWYNGLGANLTQRLSHGLLFTASYTWSKSLNDSSNIVGNNLVHHSHYGPTSLNRPQRFIASFVYQLPSPVKHESGSGLLLNGWNLSGVATIQGGLPLTLSGLNSANAYGITADQAEVTCPNNQLVTPGSVKSKLSNYFNKSCFGSYLPLGDGGNTTQFGNGGIGTVSGPGQHNLDASLGKNFALGWLKDSASVNFRAEAYNLLNMAQFANPALTQTTPSTFGTINATSVSPRVLQMALKIAF